MIEIEIDEEAIEQILHERELIRDTLGLTMEAYKDFKQAAIEGLYEFGDNFARGLCLALAHADLNDSIKILRYWHPLIEQYVILFKMKLAKEKALGAL